MPDGRRDTAQPVSRFGRRGRFLVPARTPTLPVSRAALTPSGRGTAASSPRASVNDVAGLYRVPAIRPGLVKPPRRLRNRRYVGSRDTPGYAQRGADGRDTIQTGHIVD